MRDAAQIAQYYRTRVPKLKRHGGREWRGPCPIHKGKRDSFAVNQETGVWMCHSECGRGGDIVALEMELTGASREDAIAAIEQIAGPAKCKIEAEYSYTDAKGVELFQVVRFSPKGFAQRHRGPNRQWIWNRGGAPAVLYRLKQLTEAEADTRVFVAEGERDVHTLERWRLLATTNAGGAGKWPNDAEVLRGKRVTIVPDRDKPGLAHARQVAAMLENVAAEITLLELPRGKDVTEFASLGGTRSEFLQLLEQAVMLHGEEPAESPAADTESAANTADTALTAYTAYPPSVPGWPEPLASEAFHGIAGAITLGLAPHTEADPAAILIQLLAAFGNLIGRSAHFIAEADRHYTNLFAVLVGESAKGRKGTSWGHIARVLGEVDPQWTRERITSGCGSGEGLIWAVRDDPAAPPVTVAEKRMLILEPEFARVLQVCERDANTLSAVLRQAWDSGNLRVMTKQQSALATEAHISLVGHITVDELRRRLTSNAAANGFANRFLWVCVRRSKLLPFGGNWTVDPTIIEDLSETMRWARSQEVLTRSEAANQRWALEYERLSDGGHGLFGAVTSRAEAQTMRLASLYAVLDRSTTIEEAHLAAGLAIWKYAEQSARFVFGSTTGNPLADKLLGLLGCSPHGLSRSQIRDLLHHNTSAADVEAALQQLKSLGLASREQIPTGARPVELWRAA